MKKNIRIVLTIIAALVLPLFCANAQVVSSAYQQTDSLVYRPVAAVDSTLIGKSVFSILPTKSRGAVSEVKVHQSQAIINAFNQKLESNKKRVISGYRVRIFSDSKQTARTESEAIVARFTSTHPGVAAYRSYQNPFFKVTVGDFRTKSEAMQLLQLIKYEYPTAFVVKENISYPVIDTEHSFVVDTLHIITKK